MWSKMKLEIIIFFVCVSCFNKVSSNHQYVDNGQEGNQHHADRAIPNHLQNPSSVYLPQSTTHDPPPHAVNQEPRSQHQDVQHQSITETDLELIQGHDQSQQHHLQQPDRVIANHPQKPSPVFVPQFSYHGPPPHVVNQPPPQHQYKQHHIGADPVLELIQAHEQSQQHYLQHPDIQNYPLKPSPVYVPQFSNNGPPPHVNQSPSQHQYVKHHVGAEPDLELIQAHEQSQQHFQQHPDRVIQNYPQSPSPVYLPQSSNLGPPPHVVNQSPSQHQFMQHHIGAEPDLELLQPHDDVIQQHNTESFAYSQAEANLQNHAGPKSLHILPSYQELPRPYSVDDKPYKSIGIPLHTTPANSVYSPASYHNEQAYQPVITVPQEPYLPAVYPHQQSIRYQHPVLQHSQPHEPLPQHHYYETQPTFEAPPYAQSLTHASAASDIQATRPKHNYLESPVVKRYLLVHPNGTLEHIDVGEDSLLSNSDHGKSNDIRLKQEDDENVPKINNPTTLADNSNNLNKKHLEPQKNTELVSPPSMLEESKSETITTKKDDSVYPYHPRFRLFPKEKLTEASAFTHSLDTHSTKDSNGNEQNSKSDSAATPEKINELILPVKPVDSKTPTTPTNNQINNENTDKFVDTPSHDTYITKDETPKTLDDIKSLPDFSNTVDQPKPQSFNKSDYAVLDNESSSKVLKEIRTTVTDSSDKEASTNPPPAQKEDTETTNTDIDETHTIDKNNIPGNSDTQQNVAHESAPTTAEDSETNVECSPPKEDCSIDDETSVEEENVATVITKDSTNTNGENEYVIAPLFSKNTSDAIVFQSSGDVWDKLFLEDSKSEDIMFFKIKVFDPIVDKSSKIYAFENGTTVEKIVETVWEHQGDLLPLEKKFITIIRNPSSHHQEDNQGDTQEGHRKCENS